MSARKKGFTLIELLVTITIIAVLATIGLVMYNLFLKNARDAKRQSDLRSIQSALEQYFADHFFYPGDDEVVFGGAFKSRDKSKTYINSVPNDPNLSLSYCYRSAVSSSDTNNCSSAVGICRFYYLCARLEQPGTAGTCVCTKTGNTYNFQVTPP